MSSLLRPVGSQPPGVYWFRRALVVLVVLALLLGVRWLLTGRDGTPSASPSPSDSGSSTPAASTSTSPSASPTTSGSTKPSVSATATSGGTCSDKAITVTATTDAATYAVGSTPRLRMRIQNTSKTACTRDIGAAQNELLITSGSTRVWSSDDCNPGGAAQVVTLQPGQSYSVSVTWQGRLSAKGCPTTQPLAQKGTYKLVGRNGSTSSAPAVFSLT